MPLSRRETLKLLGTGFGSVGLAASLGAAERAAPHFPARAKRVIFLYLNGGLSHVDSFDPKPALAKFDGQPMPGPKIKTDRASGGLMRSPFEFRPYGESGIEVSDIFPRVGSRIDDILVVRSMWSESVNHLPSMLMMNTGHALRGGSRPSLGSWIVYGLGTENRNLPGFVVLCPGTPVGASRNWSSSFLPTPFHGALLRNNAETPDTAVGKQAAEEKCRDDRRLEKSIVLSRYAEAIDVEKWALGDEHDQSPQNRAGREGITHITAMREQLDVVADEAPWLEGVTVGNRCFGEEAPDQQGDH